MNVCVRRVNEWDAPAMLKIYSEALSEGLGAHEFEAPSLAEFVHRVDRYTYSRGWTLADVDGWCAGFAVAHECFDFPDDPFALDVEVYAAKNMRSRGVGGACLGLLCDLALMGNRRLLRARLPASNEVAIECLKSCGFEPLRVDKAFRLKDGKPQDWAVFERKLDPADPNPTRPTKPYLVLSEDYEAARLKRGEQIKEAPTR